MKHQPPQQKQTQTLTLLLLITLEFVLVFSTYTSIKDMNVLLVGLNALAHILCVSGIVSLIRESKQKPKRRRKGGDV